MTDTLIIQFAKWPQRGKVKTRLAKTVGDQAALDAHIELTQAVLKNLTSSHIGSVELWFDQLPTDPLETNSLAKTAHACSVPIAYQSGVDLGARMYHALSCGLKTYKKVIIVGSDCPTVDTAYLTDAVNTLDKTDLVLGPAEDGGYVLLGARTLAPTLLDNIAWGLGSVLQSTIERADKLGLSYGLLDITWDVDEYDDYVRWKG